MKTNYKILLLCSLIITVFFCQGCKKLTQVPEPVNTVTTTEIFSSDATATSAIAGIYTDIVSGSGFAGNNSRLSYGNGGTTIFGGMSADELHQFGSISPYENNTLNAVSNNSTPFWNYPYYDLYIANAAINALPNAPGVSDATKKQLLGEAKFFRAFCNFYLVNLFGDVPLVLTTDYHTNDILKRSSVDQVYQQIIADLKDAQTALLADYSVSDGQRVRVNQYGATALLARVYLYQQQWALAEQQASSVIKGFAQYSLSSDPSGVFAPNSPEAILQLIPPNTSPWATKEAVSLIPNNHTSAPVYYLTSQLLSGFEPGDRRRKFWVDSTIFRNTTYYYPAKYKVRQGTANNVTEYYTVLRLAEQYLIRAEAEANGAGNGISGAINDLNTIRARAGLPLLPTTLLKDQVLVAIAQERRIELFCEWGNRWLDLKRTGQAHQVLSNLSYKQPWRGDFQLLYPIPSTELINDPNLVQNPGY